MRWSLLLVYYDTLYKIYNYNISDYPNTLIITHLHSKRQIYSLTASAVVYQGKGYINYSYNEWDKQCLIITELCADIVLLIKCHYWV